MLSHAMLLLYELASVKLFLQIRVPFCDCTCNESPTFGPLTFGNFRIKDGRAILTIVEASHEVVKSFLRVESLYGIQVPLLFPEILTVVHIILFLMQSF